jgi:hypothetical protein
MFQNDISFVFKDIDQKTEDIESIIKNLMLQHLNESVSAPFFYSYELEDLKEEIPDGWKLDIDKSKEVASNQVRLTVFNAYFEASRHFEDYEETDVKLTGESIGILNLDDDEDVNVIALRGIDAPYDDDWDKTLLELSDASGDSEIKLSVSGGSNFGNKCKTFTIPGEYVDDDFEFFKEDEPGRNNIKEIIEFIEGL